jgi:non-specific serine/threonine protein kinase/serine/threonine-protein kinase
MNASEQLSPERTAPRSNTVLLSVRQKRRMLSGDLDNIVLKALRKEPNRRYLSVEQFSEDIRRHLEGLPVTATPDSFPYRARKFVQRHKLGAAAVALIVIVIAGGVVATLRQARIAERNRLRAEARFNDVRKLAHSLIFEVHDSIASLPGATGARKVILQRALEYLDSLSKEAGNEPDLLRELATGYERIGELQGDPLSPNLGDTKSAAISLKKSLGLRESLARLNPKNSIDQVELAVAYLGYSDFQSGIVGNIASGFEYNKKAVAILDREAAVDPGNFRILAQDARGYTDLGFLQIGNGAIGSVGSVNHGVADLQKALDLDHRAVQINPKSVPMRAQESVITLLLGDAVLKLGDRPAALDYYRRAAGILSAVDPKGTNANAALNLVVIDSKIADVLLAEGKTDEAIAWFTKNHQGALRLAAADPSNDAIKQQVITSTGQLGHALIEGGKIEEGLKYERLALEKILAQPAQTPLYKIYQSIARGWIGEASERRGKLAEAVMEYRKAQDAAGAARTAGANDVRTQVFFCTSSDRLAAALLKLGKSTDAEKEYEDSRGVLEPLLQQNPGNAEVLYALAETYTGEGDVSMILAKYARENAARSKDWNDAADWYQKSLNTWHGVKNPTRISTSEMEARLPAEVSRKLSECRAQQTVKPMQSAVIR